MTPEDTSRMAEKTDRQAQIDPWKEIKAAHIYDVMTAEDESLGCDIVRAEESELNVLFCCQWNGRKGEDMCPDCRAMQARIERSLVHCIESASAVLLRERDAAQQERDSIAKQLHAEVMSERERRVAAQEGITLKYVPELEAAQQENQTLREALKAAWCELIQHDDQPWVKTLAGQVRVVGLFASPRPQEPQP